MTTLAVCLILACTVLLIYKGVEVRLVMLGSGLVLGALSKQADEVLQSFFYTLANEQYVIPICCSMGFAYVLKLTGCDEHLVRLLARPVQRVRGLLLPGAVLIGVIVNIPIISQASTCMAVGTVLVPLLRAGGVPPVLVGAALLLGASIGGELLNPGAPELTSVATALKIKPQDCVSAVLPLLILQVTVATSVFWWLNRRYVSEYPDRLKPGLQPEDSPSALQNVAEFRVNYAKAMIPLIPLILLLLIGKPFELIPFPENWLTTPATVKSFNFRLIGWAMLVGTVIAACTSTKWNGAAMSFFTGAGYAFTHIISIIAVANAFGKGIDLTGIAKGIGTWVKEVPILIYPLAAVMPFCFAMLSGSGMASTQSLFPFFVEPSAIAQTNPIDVGAVVSISSASGRTMSAVAAVTHLAGNLTGTTPWQLVKKVAPPLLIAMLVLIIATTIRHRLLQ